MSLTQASIRIDWGTHSSKWSWTRSGSDSPNPGFNIVLSDVCLEQASQRILLGVDPPPSGSISEQGIKGKIINDAGASFWLSTRRTKLTLGELVSFSLWFLLGEAYQNLCSDAGKELDELDVRFSLPNWVGIDRTFGRALYDQAAQVACHIFVSDRHAWLRDSCLLREDWQERVRQALSVLDISDDSVRSEHRDFALLLERKPFSVGSGLNFRFVAESSGAGLRGLRNAEMEAEIGKKKYLRKILVVDVGAGSTDIGYVIRSPSPDHSEEFLRQLPPADTCTIAGKNLSERLQEIYRRRGKDIAFDEAEKIKILGPDKEWLTDPAVDQWKAGIAAHVRRYVSDVPDENWLYSLPGLKVLVTGGSGAVAGLKEEVLKACIDGLRLRRRRVPLGVVDDTSPMVLRQEGTEDVNRLAVAFGAASEYFPNLRYCSDLPAPIRHPTVRPVRSWTR
jgi:hypothetical protein